MLTRANYNYENGKSVVTYSEEYAGRVLSVYQDSCRIMSDIWGTALNAVVWDDATSSPKCITLETWEYARADMNIKAEVDATEECYSKYKEWLQNFYFEKAKDRQEEINSSIVKDCNVKVISGRSGQGVTGKVAVIIERPYRSGWKSHMERKLGIATSERTKDWVAPNGKVFKNYVDITWAWARNCQRTDIPSIDVPALQEQSRAKVEYLNLKASKTNSWSISDHVRRA